MPGGSTPRLRVLALTWFYDDQPGFNVFRYRVGALHRFFDVTLVLRDQRFSREFDLPAERLHVLVRCGTGRAGLLRYLWRARQLVAQQRPDLVILLGAQMALGALWMRRQKVAIYWNEHPTHTFHGGRFGFLSRAVGAVMVALSFAGARRADLVMPIGEAHRDDLFAHGLARTNCRMFYMGVDERFSRVAEPSRPAGKSLALIYTGTVQLERGRDVMLEGLALARARGVECTLTLVGASDDQLCYCERRAAELRIAPHVRVHGRVRGDEVPALLAHADAGICAWEDRVWWRFNPPTKLFEYFVAGLPVLASRIRTHTLYVEDGRNGLIFDYDAASLAAAIQRLDASRDQLPAMRRSAIEAGRAHLWASIEPEFIGALSALAAAPLVPSA